MENLKERLNKDKLSFMKEKEIVKENIVKMILSMIMEFEKSEKYTGTTTDEDIQNIIMKMVKNTKQNIQAYLDNGSKEQYEKECLELEVLESYLPKQMSEEEISDEIDKVMAETGLSQMGPLMGILNKRLKNRADGKTISNILKNKLK